MRISSRMRQPVLQPMYPGQGRPDPIAQEVCPAGDSPLTGWHRLGWALMDVRIWPENAPSNPLIYYLMGRRWSAYLDDVLALLPWLALVTAESFLLVYCISVKSMGAWIMAGLGELIVLPIALGVWAQGCVAMQYERFRGRIPIEELYTTRLRPREILCGFALRPLLVLATANLVFTLLMIVAILACGIGLVYTNSLFHVGEFVVIIVILFYRHYLLSVCQEFAGVLALRCCLFIPSPGKRVVRMVRDWLVPWGLMPLLLPLVVAILLVVITASLFFCVVFPVALLFGTWLLFALPTVFRDYATDAIFWMERRHLEWSLKTGEEGPGVPARLIDRWKLERRAGSRE